MHSHISAVIVITTINLFVLTSCALNDDGKLIFAHVVIFILLCSASIWITY